MLREHRVIVLLSLAFLLMGALRLNDLSLYTDSTRYVLWGTSFAHAKGFVDETQPNPERYVVNAPFYSVLLSPVLLVFPYSLLAGKVWTLLWGAAFLVAFYAFLSRFFGKSIATIGVLFIAVNPLFLILSTEVLSEPAFLTFVAVCFVMLERLDSEGPSKRRDLLILLCLTSLIVLLREVAVALVGSVILYFLLRKRYKNALLVFVGFALLVGAWLYRNLVIVGAPLDSQATNVNYVFQHFVTPPQASLVQEFSGRLASNAAGYAIHLAGMFFYPIPDMMIVEPTGLFLAYYKAMTIAKYIIPIVILPLLLVGTWRDIKDRKTGLVRFVFMVAYLSIILVYPVQDLRFLLPVFLLAVFYLLVGAGWMRDHLLRVSPRLTRALAFSLLGLVVVPNLICVFEVERTNLRYTSNPLGFYEHLRQAGLGKNMFTKPWKLIGQSIRENTPEGSVIAGALKDACIFIGERKLLELNNGVPVPTFEHYLRMNAADYVMSTQTWDEFPSYEFQMGESKRFWFEPVSQVAGMRLFKVHSTYLTPRDVWLATKRMALDSTTPNGLLRLGRWQLMRGQPDDAISSLLKAQKMAPGQAMIPYQLIVAYSMSGRLTEASAELQKFYNYSQSGTYIPLASRLVSAALAKRHAEATDNPMQRSMMLFDVASFYWNAGHYPTSYSILRDILAQDSTYFVGLLWGWDYAMQRGDTVQARTCLRRLRGIDPTNPVVQQFTLIDQIEDSLRRASDPRLRGNFHLSIARSYKIVDLPEEAIDEALRAVYDDPRNTEAWLFQAQLFEEKKAPAAARRAYEHVLEVDPSNSIARSKLSSR